MKLAEDLRSYPELKSKLKRACPTIPRKRYFRRATSWLALPPRFAIWPGVRTFGRFAAAHSTERKPLMQTLHAQTTTMAPVVPAIFRPRDAAAALGINEDSVTRHCKQRPSLFPAPRGKRHEWTPAEYPNVLNVLRSLSYKAARA